MRRFDWSKTDLGPPASWPLSLKSYVSTILEMPMGAVVFWGPHQTQLYNDAYSVIMGPRHPRYLAAAYKACWPDTYPIFFPWMQRVLEDGEVVQVHDQLCAVTRHGFTEETYFTFTLSPLRDDEGKIAGILQPIIEVTDAVLGQRRSVTLRKLAAQVDSPDAVAPAAMRILAEDSRDLPLVLLYLCDEESKHLRLAAWTGLEGWNMDRVRASELGRVARRSFDTETAEDVEDLERALGHAHLGVWPEPTRSARVVPLRRSSWDETRGVVVLGVSPRLRLDDRYRDFMDEIARGLAANLAAEQSKKLERELLEREQEARREAELQKEHLATLLIQAPTPMAILRGTELVIELANEKACQVWMRNPADVIGRRLFDALPELRDQGFAKLVHRVFRSREPVVGRETPIRRSRPDGTVEELCLSFVFAPLQTTSGRVNGVLIIGFDVTEQVRARQQMNELRSAAESASRAKDEFFAILGHELRNPLAPIMTALELMRMQGTGGRERQVIERQANHLVRLVDDLLDISRIIRGKIELRKEQVTLEEVVTRAIEMARPLLEQRKHELVVDMPGGGLFVDGDAGRLAQAIANLLTNAAKYTEVGGRVTIVAVQHGGEVEVHVRDNGIGIAAAMLPRVFDAFVQERQALDRSQGGLGLGLSIVRGIVELHGGRVEALSEGQGSGSDFVVHLPASASTALATGSSRPPRAAVAGKRGAGRCILLVDDNQDAADMLALSLERAGHRVSVAHDGPSALRLVGGLKPDVALLDIGLPLMDGYELARRLRECPELKRLPLVAVTGYGRETDRTRSRAAGFEAHLVKPLDLSQVDKLVRTLAPRRSAVPRPR